MYKQSKEGVRKRGWERSEDHMHVGEERAEGAGGHCLFHPESLTAKGKSRPEGGRFCCLQHST